MNPKRLRTTAVIDTDEFHFKQLKVFQRVLTNCTRANVFKILNEPRVETTGMMKKKKTGVFFFAPLSCGPSTVCPPILIYLFTSIAR